MFSAKPSWQGQVTIRLDDDHNVLIVAVSFIDG
jgi:hypothetical protein